jgi:RHS repeat-associated protein
VEADQWQTGGTTTVTRTAYDALNTAWADLNGSNVVQTRYLSGPGTNQWLARIDGSGMEWLLGDRLGSVRDVIASAGTLVLDHAEYGVFGTVASETGSTNGGVYLYTGLRQDRAEGIAFPYGRALFVSIGRFVAPDPSGFDGGYNLYRYAGNDPTNATDPSGLDPDTRADRIDRQNGYPGDGAVLVQWWQSVFPPPQQVRPPAPRREDVKVKEAFKYFLKSPPAKEFYERVAKDLGGLDVAFDPSIEFRAEYDINSKPPRILLDPNKMPDNDKNDLAALAGKILFETINASNAALFQGVSERANKGELSRIDYAVAYEKIEFDGVVKHHEIAGAAFKARDWDESADMYASYAGKSFDYYLTKALGDNHTQSYAKYWDKNYKKSWENKHPGAKPDDPQEEDTKKLEQGTIESLQKAFNKGN